ncbi:uncharacterized protein A4U43_C06F15900 [Asparagus officinalis]|uniref:Two-component response regulator n=2 Tax=Asparagus officinalis TaxID=4686 RepID=A0A5P1EM85_ASPOF|nr:uncharacterized protein A4U43_C06F15900 [Asparagus officinalis]
MTMMSSSSSLGSSGGEKFPVGMRVLVVDDDVTCLKILDQMLQRCRYRVTTCCQATVALSLLRERRGGFDVVISDVHMPDMDGFNLLELVGLEMDLPVIMMSADGGTETVMRGIKHGACDYLIKPVRIEELKNIWQHVIRKKKWNESRELEYSGGDDSDPNRRVSEDTECASSVNDGADGISMSHKKKREDKEDEDDGELDHEDPSSSKKPRVVWSVELHQQFVSAVSQLGIEKAVPKRILELMNVPGLTRENVASHLQKFRLYLKRISGVAQQQNGIPSSLCGPVEPDAKVGSGGRLDFQALAASGQIHPETLAALHAELLGRPSGSLVFPAMDQPVLQSSRQGPQCIPSERDVQFGQPLFKCQSRITKQFPTSGIGENMSADFSIWPSNYLGTADAIKNVGGVNNTPKVNMMMQVLQQQQQPYPVVSEPHHIINVQPSCLVVPSRPSNSLSVSQGSLLLNQSSIGVQSESSNKFQSENSSGTVKSSSNINGVPEYRLPSLSNKASLHLEQSVVGDTTNIGVLNGSSVSFSSSLSSYSTSTNSGTGSERKAGKSFDQAQARNLGFVGKGTCIPSRFAVDDIESPTSEQCVRNTSTGDDGARVKQELQLDFTDSSQVGGSTMLPHFSSNNFMSVLSEDGLQGHFTEC